MKTAIRAVTGLIVVGGLIGVAAFVGGVFDSSNSAPAQTTSVGVQPTVAAPAPIVAPVVPTPADVQMQDAIGDMNLNGN